MRRGGSHNYRGGRGPPLQQAALVITPPPLESVVGRLETMARLLHAVGKNSTHPEEIHNELRLMYQDLTRVGPHLETAYPDVLDRVMSSMRDASAESSLSPSLRLAIFQLVELRASHWSLRTNYYTERIELNKDDGIVVENGTHGSVSTLGSSGLPTPASSNDGKSFHQEIIIKNSDSGKVMGVRGRRVHQIEALSDTIISFEKVPTSQSTRTLVVNGKSNSAVLLAKELIEETIERNASPVLDLETRGRESGDKFSPPTSPVEGPEFSYSIQLGRNVIRISGTHLPFVQEGKLVLDEHFLQKYPHLFYSTMSPVDSDIEPQTSTSSPKEQSQQFEIIPKRWKYDRKSLLEIERNAILPQPLPQFLSSLEPSMRNSIALQKRRVLNIGVLDQNVHMKPERKAATERL